MTGSSLQFGLYSTRDCRDVGSGDIDTAIREGMVCYIARCTAVLWTRTTSAVLV
ncbi:hypothetical protein [Neisseria subflava]|uniref:hypothetical protein n=1 Tax=Neisseria subflava TaxID=28449 RepID=UPI00202A0D44|nr:hypothetical protein [Neisseria subflava]MCL9779789.1 hypothetical protein [Neisseria subflava]